MKFEKLFSTYLPTDEVANLYQDSDGFMWIVTYNGLVRYDGYETVAYTRLSEDDDAFDGWPHVIMEDHDKQLYIGTERGLILLDKKSRKLQKLQDVATADLNVTDIVVDSTGRVWVGGNMGVFRNDASGAFSNIDLRQTPGGSPLTDIIDMLIDDKGNLWITSWYKGLYRYDLKTGKLYCYADGDLLSSYVLHYDAGTLWIGTWGDGLLKADLSEMTDSDLPYVAYKRDRDVPGTILDDIIYDIEQGPSGKIWVGSRSGLSILEDPDKGIFLNEFPEDGYGNLPYNEVNSILRTRDNSMWLAMMGGGVCKVVNEAAEDNVTMNMDKLRKAYKTSTVKSMYQIDSESYWLGLAGHGLIRYDSEDGSFANYMSLRSFNGFKSTSIVEAIMKRSCTGEICFGSYNDGLWIYNPVTGATWALNSTTRSEMGNDCIHALDEDPNDNVWIGTSSGVYVLDGANNVFTLRTFLGQKGSNPDYLVNDISVDLKSDFVWLATRYDGIVRIDTGTGEIKSYFTGRSDKIRNFSCVQVDSKGTVWAGSAWYGLYVYDEESDTFLSMDHFTFLKDQGIGNIVEGPEGKIWITTNNKVIAFMTDDPDKGYELDLYKTLSSEKESISVSRNSGLYLPEHESMAFGCSRGIMLFPCGRDSSAVVLNEVTITDVSVDGMSCGMDSVSEVRVDHKSNDLKISFSMFNYNDPEGDIFKWRLLKKVGKSEYSQWITVNGRQNSAEFKSLKPGRYTFEICGKGSDGSGYGEVKTLDIKVVSNPWTAWWTFILYILIVALLVSALIYMTRRYLELKRRFSLYRKTQEENQLQILPLNEGVIPDDSKVLCEDSGRHLIFEVKDIEYTPMNKKFLQRAMDVVNTHIADSDFRQSDFAEAMAVSKTVLTEKLKNLTGLTPSAFLLNARLTLAYKLLMEENEITRVSDLAYTVGFSDAKYFSKKFKAKYGKTPREIINEKKES